MDALCDMCWEQTEHAASSIRFRKWSLITLAQLGVVDLVMGLNDQCRQ